MLPATQVVFRSVLCDSCAIERKASLTALWRAIMQHEKLDCAITCPWYELFFCGFYLDISFLI